jgi:hypothetical protein
MPPKKKQAQTKETNQSKTKGLFDHIEQIYVGQNPDYFDTLSDADKKSYSVYMVNKFLSMNPHQSPFVNEMQKYTLPNDIHYAFFSRVIPKGRQFNKYIKSKKESVYESWMVDLVRKHYDISAAEATDYLEIYYKHNKEELRKLCQMYGTEEKVIKKAKL